MFFCDRGLTNVVTGGLDRSLGVSRLGAWNGTRMSERVFIPRFLARRGRESAFSPRLRPCTIVDLGADDRAPRPDGSVRTGRESFCDRLF